METARLFVKKRVSIAIIMVFIAFSIKRILLPMMNYGVFHELMSMISNIIYIFIFLFWGFSIKVRVINDATRHYLFIISKLCVFWILVRLVKFQLLGEHVFFYTTLWYAYYIPIILIPLFTLFASDCIWKKNDYKPPLKLRLLIVPAIFMIIVVLTNDLHNKVFHIIQGIRDFEVKYTYNYGYFVILSWVAVISLIALLNILIKSYKTKIKYTWLPFALFFLMLTYAAMYIDEIPFIVKSDMSIVYCLFTISILESCVKIGLIPSNIAYIEFINKATIAAFIMDRSYNIRYSSGISRKFPLDILKKVENETVLIDDGKSQLLSVPINGGNVVWVEDISEIFEARRRLSDTQDKLSEQNLLLQEEIKYKSRKARIDTKIRVYESILMDVSPKFEILNNILSEDVDAKEYKKQIALSCIIGAYIKRRCDLGLMEEDGMIASQELEFCIKETLEYMDSYGVLISINSKCSNKTEVKNIIAVYDFFENIIENCIDKVDKIKINLDMNQGDINLKLLLSPYCNVSEVSGENIVFLGGVIRKTGVSDGQNIYVYLPRGGEKH